MAQPTASTNPIWEEVGYEAHEDLPLDIQAIAYEGAALGFKPGGTNWARQLVAGDKFAGFAIRKQDNSADLVGGASSVRARTKGRTIVSVAGGAGNASDVDSVVYASDGQTFTTVAGGNSRVGVISRWISGTTYAVSFASDVEHNA